MNKTIKLLTVALALTTATQSFSMWNRLRCAASSMRLNVAPRLNTMRASLPKWTNHLNFSRSAVAIRPAFARAAAVRTAAGLGAVAAYANYAKPARAESVTGETSIAHASFHPNADGTTTIKTKLQGNAEIVISYARAEEAKKAAEVEWTPEAMQAKLNELKAQEAVKMIAGVSVVVEGQVEGEYKPKLEKAKKWAAFMQQNRAMIAQCLAREATFNDESRVCCDDTVKTKCKDLYKQMVDLPEETRDYNYGRFHAALGLPRHPAWIDPVKGQKAEYNLDIHDENEAAKYTLHGKITVPANSLPEFDQRPIVSVLAKQSLENGQKITVASGNIMLPPVAFDETDVYAMYVHKANASISLEKN